MSAWDELLADGFAGKLTALPTLQLACGFTDQEAARFCFVSPETYRRWRSDRPPSRAALRLLAIRAGLLPWPAWRGWQVHDGLLFAPGQDRGGLMPGDLLAVPLLHQLVNAQRQQLEQLRLESRAGRAGQRTRGPRTAVRPSVPRTRSVEPR